LIKANDFAGSALETAATKVNFTHRKIAENSDALLPVKGGVRNLDVADSFFAG
jgi:hypothetical protein